MLPRKSGDTQAAQNVTDRCIDSVIIAPAIPVDLSEVEGELRMRLLERHFVVIIAS
jgi:hypothetical protein